MNTVFAPRRVDSAVVLIDNLVASRRVMAEFALAGQSATISLQPSQYERDYNMAFRVVVNQAVLTVLIDQEMLDAYVGLICAEVTFVDLPDALREGVAIRFWEELVSGVAQARGMPLSLQSVTMTQPVSGALGVTTCMALQLGNACFYGQISMSTDWAPWLEQVLSTFPVRQRTPSASTPVMLRFEKGRTQITRDELLSVEPFDVILFDVVWQDLLVSGGPERCFRASMKSTESDDALSAGLPGSEPISGRLSNSAALVSVAVTVEEVVEDVQNPEVSGDVSSIPVTLTFEVDRQKVTLGDLMQIGPGYTFHLAANAQAPIQILANGQMIGSAELVQIGDQKLGARVLALKNT